jgi:hypothetical protein
MRVPDFRLNDSTILGLDASITSMATVRWLVGVLLIGFSLIVCTCNIALVSRWSFRNERSSLVLVIGGLVAVAGLLVLPSAAIHRWFWLPPIADICIPYFAAFGFSIVKKTSRP